VILGVTVLANAASQFFMPAASAAVSGSVPRKLAPTAWPSSFMHRKTALARWSA